MLINHGPSLLNVPAKLMTPEKAEHFASLLQESDEDWTYVVKHCPEGTGFSRIAIYDEDGEFIAFWQ